MVLTRLTALYRHKFQLWTVQLKNSFSIVREQPSLPTPCITEKDWWPKIYDGSLQSCRLKYDNTGGILLLPYLHLRIYKWALQMWQPRARQSKGGTPSTPYNKRKKELVRDLSFLRCITKPKPPFSQVQLHRLSFFFTIWATIRNGCIPSMRIHEKSEANFKLIRVFKYCQMCSPSFCCPNSSDEFVLLAAEEWFLFPQRMDKNHKVVFFYTFTGS